MRNVLAALVAATCLSAPAFAQSAAVTLQPETAGRWDFHVNVGWLGVNKADIAPEWNNWYEAASAGVSAGYYLTPHLKLELDIARSTEGHVFSYPIGFVPGRPRQDEFRTTVVNGTIAYQFFDNTWFHPFVATGFDAVHESSRTRFGEYFVRPQPPAPPVVLPGEITEWESSVRVRPMIGAGFKWYVAERAFIRSDLKTAFSTRRSESLLLRIGVGFDF